PPVRRIPSSGRHASRGEWPTSSMRRITSLSTTDGTEEFMSIDTARSGSDDDVEIREIQAAAAPTRFARGWHCLGLLRDFQDGKPHSIEAFGTKLVVFADSKGQLNVLDAYCRHM